MSQLTTNQEWLKVLGKGMVTLPKKWRDELGIDESDIVRAKKEGDRVVIESRKGQAVRYRVYSAEEIKMFIKDDQLPENLVDKVNKYVTSMERS